MKHATYIAASIAAILGVLALVGWYEVVVWQECRTDHSWLYCLRVLH